jgi:hypothetical protein
MKVLVDTSVWSLALRRRASAPHAAVEELRSLVIEGRVVIIGAIRQELLSGIRDAAAFTRLRDHLRAFPDDGVETADYERAAEWLNMCRTRGVQGSNTDFLLCAVSERLRLPLFTTDRDFRRFAAILPLRLHEPRPGL